ncbi:hypothetical protein [Blastococcus sp. SYSU D00820]
MTSTTTAARPAHRSPALTLPAARPPVTTTVADACPVELRALRGEVRTLADAVTGIVFDAPCCPARQQAVEAFAQGVLAAVRGSADRHDDVPVHTAAVRAAEALPLFGADVSAGAPHLARALADLADLLDARAAVAGTGHEHGHRVSLVDCERRFRSAAGSALFGVPWFLDAASPAERVLLIGTAPRRLRWLLRLGEDRWLRLRDAVRG